MKCLLLWGVVAALSLGQATPFRPKRTLAKQTAVKRMSTVLDVPRGGGNSNVVVEAAKGLQDYMKGPKADALLLLSTTALNTPICNALKFSPILGFLALGVCFGPNGLGWIKDIHTTEMLADIGIVFFLFEMGIHLSVKTLMKMRSTVFGLGGSQFAITAVAIGLIATHVFGLSTEAAIIIGGGLALSSSAFVLQLLKDKDQLGTEYGESSFGVLLLQDLMVVPLLVITPILAGGGDGIGAALTSAGTQLVMALSGIALIGKFIMGPVFDKVVGCGSQEALVGLVLTTVLGMSFLTEGLGLSNTLGAFLAGVLLAENPHVHQIEKEASPIRGILVGLFFFTVGFEIDLNLIADKAGLIAGLVTGLVALKTTIAASVAKVHGLDNATSQRIGLVLSQGGEFAFVAFRAARDYGILDANLTKLLLTVVSLTMALTPFLEDYGAALMEKAAGSGTQKKTKKR
jgi:CPA2 family monovalent cation:H+ antiporter-2